MIIAICGLPGRRKTLIAEAIRRQKEWQMYSVGQILRDIWATLGKPDGRFDMWVSTLSMDKLKRVHMMARETIEKMSNEGGNLILEVRNPMLLNGLPDVHTFFIEGDIQESARICEQIEQEKYPGMIALEIQKVLREREDFDVHTSLQLFGCDHRILPYNQIIDSVELGVERSAGAILSALPAI